MDEILNMIIWMAAILLLLVLIILATKAYNYLKSRMKKEDAEALDKFVGSLVAAAEQMLKAIDPDGSKRLGYVQGMLIEAGYDLTDAINALIESKVFAINKAVFKNE